MKRSRLLIAYAPAVKIEISPPTSKETALASFPRTRGECEDGERPCPFATCRYWLDHEQASCALDIADEGRHTQHQVAALLGVSQPGVLKIERRAIRKARLYRG